MVRSVFEALEHVWTLGVVLKHFDEHPLQLVCEDSPS